MSLQDRRRAAARLPRLHCGCVDPDVRTGCDHPPTDRMVDGYRDAVLLLDSLGLPPAPRLPEMRALWRRGGADRELVASVTSRWVVA